MLKRLELASFEELANIYEFEELVNGIKAWGIINSKEYTFPFGFMGLSEKDKLTEDEWRDLEHKCYGCDELLNYADNIEYDETQLEAAELIAFLRSVKGSEVKLNGTIINPKEGEVKGTTKMISIGSCSLINTIEGILLDELSIIHADNYRKAIGSLNAKVSGEHSIIHDDNNNYNKDLDYLLRTGSWKDFLSRIKKEKMYSDEAIQNAIEFEKVKKLAQKDIPKTARLGMEAFFSKQKIDKVITKKVPQTKINSFIYDLFSLYGFVSKYEFGLFKGTEAKEKSDKVKYWIKCWQKFQKEYEKLVQSLPY